MSETPTPNFDDSPDPEKAWEMAHAEKPYRDESIFVEETMPKGIGRILHPLDTRVDQRIIDRLMGEAEAAAEDAAGRVDRSRGIEIHVLPVDRIADEEILSERKVKSKAKLGGGISETHMISLENDGKAVFKVEKYGAKTDHERAAYLVSEALGFKFVPPTVSRAVKGKRGSVQRFIPNARTGRELRTGELQENYPHELAALRLFDRLIVNIDRHAGNYLLAGGILIAIDHNLARFNGGLFDIPIISDDLPDALIESIVTFQDSPVEVNKLQRELSGLLGAELSNKFMIRLSEFVKDLRGKKAA